MLLFFDKYDMNVDSPTVTGAAAAIAAAVNTFWLALCLFNKTSRRLTPTATSAGNTFILHFSLTHATKCKKTKRVELLTIYSDGMQMTRFLQFNISLIVLVTGKCFNATPSWWETNDMFISSWGTSPLYDGLINVKLKLCTKNCIRILGGQGYSKGNVG